MHLPVTQPVLIVEDDLSLAQALIGALEPTGIHVEHSVSAELAMELLRSRQYAVVVVEMVPASGVGISGSYLVKALRKLPKEKRPGVIMLASASASLRGVDRGTVAALLFKPLDLPLFAEYVTATYRRALSSNTDGAVGETNGRRCFCGHCDAPIAAWIADRPETFDAWLETPCPGCGTAPSSCGGRTEWSYR